VPRIEAEVFFLNWPKLLNSSVGTKKLIWETQITLEQNPKILLHCTFSAFVLVGIRKLLLYLLRQTPSKRLIMPGETQRWVGLWLLLAAFESVQCRAVQEITIYSTINHLNSEPAKINSRPYLLTQCQCWCQLWINYVKGEGCIICLYIINAFWYLFWICWDNQVSNL